MLTDVSQSSRSSRTRLRACYREPEDSVLARLLPIAELSPAASERANRAALALATVIREAASANTNIQDLLNEYALSTREGIVLMCLAEALLRVPDALTADRLIRDKLLSGDWSSHLGKNDSLFVNASAWGLLLSGKLVSFNQTQVEQDLDAVKKVLGRLGEPVIRAAMKQGMRIMGTQFVLGRHIQEALSNAKKQEAKGYSYSYDMLGEAARTMADADAYAGSYRHAIEQIGRASQAKGPVLGPGISVKLSALHPRYELAQGQRVMTELLPRLKSLALLAKQANIGFTIDAEETHRLELSMELIEQLFSDPDLADWDGFGMAIQAYQKRGIEVVGWVIDLCQRAGKKMMVRLVKGAYWDSEIKLSQVEGQSGYPVFTRKASTDLSYQACARMLLDNRALVYPQFATHNAYTVAVVMALAGAAKGFEFQRLHGMGDALYDHLLKQYQMPCRIYAPVGEHENLLAYLVRRLLENGANTSFVNHILDDRVPISALIQDPVAKVKSWPQKANPQIPLPGAIYGEERRNSSGFDLTDLNALYDFKEKLEAWCKANLRSRKDSLDAGLQWAVNPANKKQRIGLIPITGAENFPAIVACAAAAFQAWSERPVRYRADCLNRLADRLEQQRDELLALCIKEAGKTLKDSVAEVREAIDFCRYYAYQAQQISLTHGTQLAPRGIILCISPWNFPLAIFLGQVSAAIAAGNAVIAKPAAQTGLIAQRTLALMQQSGLPTGLVQLVNCRGVVVGEKLAPQQHIQGVMFTGSTATGAWIARALSQREGEPVPLIAETGGQNCMLVDSTALPEQVVDDVISSGFQSAGQRCSALRVLFLQEEVADKIIGMLVGAMRELRVGDPARLHTDVGPVIDEKALAALNAHLDYLQGKGKLLYACALSEECRQGTFFAPRLYEIDSITQLKDEVFGPVVHVIRYRADELDHILSEINSTGFGLTFGLHSRIQTLADKTAAKINAGNIYVNRNMIGAVVGVQPFGGHGLSGTGPKAGGPDYLYRLMRQRSKVVSPGRVSVRASDHGRQQTKSFADLLAQLKQSFQYWRQLPVLERAARLTKRLALIRAEGESQDLVLQSQQFQSSADEICRRQQQAMILTGPTGELNQLLYEPRGVLLSLDSCRNDLSQTPLNTQVLAALLAGNTVLHLCLSDGGSGELEASLNHRGVPIFFQDSLALEADSLARLVRTEEISGVLIQGDAELVRRVNQWLSQRAGALLPLIIETAEPLLSKRVVLEKAVSTNTTASGGNASLLAIGDD